MYISTSGVYGDCDGERVDETRAVNPQTPRAVRRVDAEQQLLAWGGRHAIPVVVLRAPGIYSAGRLPVERLMKGTPVLEERDDVYTNHIHADDLAAIALAVAGLAAALPAAAFLRAPSSARAKGIETAAGLWTLASYLVLALTPFFFIG